jgi:hypothetical protein
MKPAVVLLAMLSLMLVAVVVRQESKIDDDTASTVPLQALPSLSSDPPESCRKIVLQQAINGALVKSGISAANIDALQKLSSRISGRLVRRILDCHPWSLGSDQVQLSAAVLDAWLRKHRLRFLSPTARRVCTAFRWQSASFEGVAESCDRVLFGLPGRWAVRSIPSITGLHLDKPAPALLDANRRFLQAPYDAARVIRLALALEQSGHTDAARRLHREAAQISPDAAAALDNALHRQAGSFRPPSAK